MNKNPLYPVTLCQVMLKFAQWFWRRKCFQCTTVLLSTLVKGRNRSFEQTWIPFIQGCFVQSFSWYWLTCSAEELFNISSMYFRFVIISLWKRAWPFFWTIFIQRWFLSSLMKLGKWLWRRKGKWETFTDRQTDGQTDGSWSEKFFWAYNSGELKRALNKNANSSLDKIVCWFKTATI